VELPPLEAPPLEDVRPVELASPPAPLLPALPKLLSLLEPHAVIMATPSAPMAINVLVRIVASKEDFRFRVVSARPTE
jgi:hypothetical protein